MGFVSPLPALLLLEKATRHMTTSDADHSHEKGWKKVPKGMLFVPVRKVPCPQCGHQKPTLQYRIINDLYLEDEMEFRVKCPECHTTVVGEGQTTISQDAAITTAVANWNVSARLYEPENNSKQLMDI